MVVYFNEADKHMIEVVLKMDLSRTGLKSGDLKLLLVANI
jgi:hypothetical protein